jgi:hypothetical protein
MMKRTERALRSILNGGAAANETAGVPAARVRPAMPAVRKRLVLAVDATYSRETEWDVSQRVMGSLFTVLPGSLDVALAVHGGNRILKFTDFTSNADELREMAAGVKCEAGRTRLLDILARVALLDGVAVVVYIGDCYEESELQARDMADTLGRRGTRVIVLHDGPPLGVFRAIAERSGGALLPFDISAMGRLRELLEACAVLAVGGAELLEAKKATMPAATLLLEHLDPKRLLIEGR